MIEAFEINGRRIEVQEGDITSLAADAIVNAANNHLWMGAGVAGAIKRRGGAGIEKEAVAKGPVTVGQAVATTAGMLQARYVIHGAVMGQDLRTDARLIAETTRNALKLAAELECASIALPAFGTGVGGFPLAESAEIMLREVIEHLRLQTSLQRVIFALYGRQAADVFRQALARVKQA